MNGEPEVRDKEGKPVELVPVKSVRLKRGGREVLERLPWYSGPGGEWFVDRKGIEDFIK